MTTQSDPICTSTTSTTTCCCCTSSTPTLPKYKILIVNDDGIHAPGIRYLAESLSTNPTYDIRVSAPSTGQSAAAAKITLKGSLEVSAHPGLFRGVPWAVSVGGTPVDSLRVGLHLCGPGWRPDLVLSGVNVGNNLGMCTLYSGTVSAALDSALLGVPAISLSYDVPSYERPITEAEVAEMGEVIGRVCPRVVEMFRERGVPGDHVVNVNIPHPKKEKEEKKKVKEPVIRLAMQSFSVLKSGYSKWLGKEEEEMLDAMMTALDIDRGKSVDPRIAELELPWDVDVISEGDVSLSLTPIWPHADIVSAYKNISKWI